MVKLNEPRGGRKRPPGKTPPRVVRLRGAECPKHHLPVYLDGRRLFCPACDRWTVTRRD